MTLKLFDTPNFVHTVLEGLPVGIYIVDRDQRIRFWNRGAELATGHPAHEVVGRIFTAHIVGAHDADGKVVDEQHNPVAMTLGDGQPRQIAAHFLHREGHRIPVALRCRPIICSGDAIEGAIVLFEEATGARSDTADTSLYGCLDAVTGIPSHRLTRALLGESVAGMEESRHGFGLLRIRILGLDEFRSKHGPHSIVPFMRAAAHTVRHNLDATAFLGRWGEDEFIAVLPFIDLMAAAAAAHRIWNLLTTSEVRWWGDRFPIQAVVMHAVAQPGDKLEELLNGLEPMHAAAAGRAVGMPAGSLQPRVRAAHAAERG